ncbi:helix-turn-helix transcriptional regulator [Schinkia azotoformans]|uniref:helix-turn-helix domain-containing protein n=1 Tax=Schinkia azotoformans TaxID=1454 RepID=UPI002E230F98|nr:helix-turn-helix transcriptional regulator [Schinkia azotoformans]
MIENFDGIGDRIAAKLEELKLKQTDVCKATGISKNAMSNYVGGNRVPDTLATYKLSKFLSVSIEWLLTGEENKNDSDSSLNDLHIVDRNLLEKIKQLSDEERKRIEYIIEGLLIGHELNDNKRGQSSESINGEEAATSETA